MSDEESTEDVLQGQARRGGAGARAPYGPRARADTEKATVLDIANLSLPPGVDEPPTLYDRDDTPIKPDRFTLDNSAYGMTEPVHVRVHVRLKQNWRSAAAVDKPDGFILIRLAHDVR